MPSEGVTSYAVQDLSTHYAWLRQLVLVICRRYQENAKVEAKILVPGLTQLLGGQGIGQSSCAGCQAALMVARLLGCQVLEVPLILGTNPIEEHAYCN